MASLLKLKKRIRRAPGDTRPLPKDSGKTSGYYAVQFRNGDGKRLTVFLGNEFSKDQALTIKGHIQKLASASIAGTGIPPETANWLGTIGRKLRHKLEHVKLVEPMPELQPEPETRAVPTLAEFIDGYIAKCGKKPNTVAFFTQTRRCLVDYFREVDAKDPARAGKGDRRVDDVKAYDMVLWNTWMRQKKGGRLSADGRLAEATIRRRCGIAKQFFNAAIKDHYYLKDENPILVAELRCSFKKNKKKKFGVIDPRFHEVTWPEVNAVLDACPDLQWRLLILLPRVLGLRSPSEVLPLKWGDVNFEHRQITIHSPKTEHHEDGGERLVPIFPEIYDTLLQAFHEAPEGSTYIITRYRDLPGNAASVNLRTQFTRIIKRAGLKPWPKLFQNMRRTRQIELVRDLKFPEYVVCEWIGNSEKVATEHYFRVTQADFDRAAVASAMQIPVSQHAARTRIEVQNETRPAENRGNPREAVQIGANRDKTCARGESNPHGFPHRILNPARLPVPPLAPEGVERRLSLPVKPASNHI